MQPVLERYETADQREPAVVVIDRNTVGYIEPIYLQPLCVTCHGKVIAPEVEAMLDQLRCEGWSSTSGSAAVMQRDGARGGFYVDDGIICADDTTDDTTTATTDDISISIATRIATTRITTTDVAVL